MKTTKGSILIDHRPSGDYFNAHIRIKINGEMKTFQKKFRERPLAEQYLAHMNYLEGQMKSTGKVPDELMGIIAGKNKRKDESLSDSKTLKECFAFFMSAKKPPKNTRHGIESLERNVKTFIESIGKNYDSFPAKNITPELMHNLNEPSLFTFFRELKRTNTTIIHHLNLLATILRLCVKNNFIESEDFKLREFKISNYIKVDTPSQPSMSTWEIKELLRAAKKVNHDFYVYLLLLYTTGCRKGEALQIRWEDIRPIVLAENELRETLPLFFIRIKTLKKKKKQDEFRSVPISKELMNALLRWNELDFSIAPDCYFKKTGLLFKRRINQRNIYPLWKETIKQTKLEYLLNENGEKIKNHFHIIRHSFITISLNNGIDPYKVAKVVGHSSLNMIMEIYGKLEVQRLEPFVPELNL